MVIFSTSVLEVLVDATTHSELDILIRCDNEAKPIERSELE
jgi:hypothetical protein